MPPLKPITPAGQLRQQVQNLTIEVDQLRTALRTERQRADRLQKALADSWDFARTALRTGPAPAATRD